MIRKYWNIITAEPQPIRFLTSRVLMKSGLSKFFHLERQGFVLRFYPSPTAAQIWMNPSYEREEDKFFRAYLREGDVVVDGGANIGLLTLLAASMVGDAGHVYSIEAHPRICGYLRENVKVNKFRNVKTFNYALGDKDGTISFTDEHWDEINSVIVASATTPTIEVQTRRLDSLGIEHPTIHLLKIDVEGFELPAFTGGAGLLERTQCIYFESNKAHFARFNYTCRDLFVFLQNHGFHLFRFTENEYPQPIESSYESLQNDNLLAVRDPAEFHKRISHSR